jgi:hypothetical protein
MLVMHLCDAAVSVNVPNTLLPLLLLDYQTLTS